jgi:hypothetical protein
MTTQTSAARFTPTFRLHSHLVLVRNASITVLCLFLVGGFLLDVHAGVHHKPNSAPAQCEASDRAVQSQHRPAC